mgnify:CR=1 FL=1
MRIIRPWQEASVSGSLHLHHGIGLRAVSREEASVDRTGVDKDDALMALHCWPWSVADHHPPVAAVIGLPEGLPDRQIGLPVAVETGMRGTPAFSAVFQRQLLKAIDPGAGASLPELADGVLAEQGFSGAVAARLQRIDQVLFMIAAQPGGTPQPHQGPHQIHRGFDPPTSIDHIPAEDQMIVRGQHRQQGHQGPIAAVNITDDPVVLTRGWQRIDRGEY